MCSSKTPASMNKKRRKSRLSKPKKPKFLSLRRQFPPNEMPPAAAASRQLDLFPLHPDNDRESQDQADVALFFSATDSGATTLTGLLDNSSAVDSNSSHTNNNSCRVDYLSQSSASLTYAYGEERAALVRTALRSRDRESGEEEKWVCYSEVVERKVKEEEVTSSAVDRWPAAAQGVSLKLDYEEIMNAWSNKGPLFVDAETSQIVPDIKHHFLSHPASNHEASGWGCNSSALWRVPEMVGEIENDHNNNNNNNNNSNNNSIGQRKASVLRYKEKRQNRLFSKKIRYQVRKLNAEKRPRLKGRFVKKS